MLVSVGQCATLLDEETLGRIRSGAMKVEEVNILTDGQISVDAAIGVDDPVR